MNRMNNLKGNLQLFWPFRFLIGFRAYFQLIDEKFSLKTILKTFLLFQFQDCRKIILFVNDFWSIEKLIFPLRPGFFF